jgi:hypothetical protein
LYVSSILLDDIESVLDVRFAEYESDDLLSIRMKMKSRESLSQIYSLCSIHPTCDNGDSISHIVYHYRYQCPYDNTSEKKYHYIYSDDSEPCGNIIFLTSFYERIDEYRHESCNHDDENER